MVLHAIKMDTEQLQLLSFTPTVDWHLGSKCVSFETNNVQTVGLSPTCRQLWFVYQKPHQYWRVEYVVDWLRHKYTFLRCILLTSWSRDGLFSCYVLRKPSLLHYIIMWLYTLHTDYSSSLASIHETVQIITVCVIDSSYANTQCTNVLSLRQHCTCHYNVYGNVSLVSNW